MPYTHGTPRGYWSPHFCRCPLCVAAQAEYSRQRRARLAHAAGRPYHRNNRRPLCLRGHVKVAGRCPTCARDAKRTKAETRAVPYPWTVHRASPYLRRRYRTREAAVRAVLRLRGTMTLTGPKGRHWVIARA